MWPSCCWQNQATSFQTANCNAQAMTLSLNQNQERDLIVKVTRQSNYHRHRNCEKVKFSVVSVRQSVILSKVKVTGCHVTIDPEALGLTMNGIKPQPHFHDIGPHSTGTHSWTCLNLFIMKHIAKRAVHILLECFLVLL